MATNMQHWIESGGGPLLFVSRDLIGFWEGARDVAPFREANADSRWRQGGKATDYDRACDIDDLIGVIGVGPGTALVLGDEPLPTTWIAEKTGGGTLVRWVAADDDESALALAHEASAGADWAPGPLLEVADQPLVLFDSAIAGDERPRDELEVVLSAGRYRVYTARMQGDDGEAEVLLHRLIPERPV